MPQVGETQPEDVGLYTILHPMQEGFGAIVFRPQLWILDYPNFEHDADRPAIQYEMDEKRRPQVLSMRAWGNQNASGDWSYEEAPNTSRAQGGRSKGGVLFSPSQFEMEDYFAIKSVTDVKDVTPA